MSALEWAQIGAIMLFAFVLSFAAPSIANDVAAGVRRGRQILSELEREP